MPIASSANLCRAVQGAETLGLVWTAYELGRAAMVSVREKSWRPFAIESVGQGGSWAAGVAGMKAGGKLGAVIGLKTGPGAVVTAAVGAGIGGLAGYVVGLRAARKLATKL